MTSLIFEYLAFDKSKNQIEVIPNISVNFSVKLIILNPTIDPSPGIVDSSAPFYSETIKVGEGFPSKEVFTDDGGEKVVNQRPLPDAIKGDNTVRVNLSEYMNKSDIFKRFWAKWSNLINENDRNNNKAYYEYIPGNYYALEITQTFKGDVNYAGFSQVNYLPVLGFYNGGNRCTQRDCRTPDFMFDDTNVSSVEVYVLAFNKEDIVNKQVKASNLKIDYERELENYRSQLKAQSLDLILSTSDYQPNSFTKVITRLLEFQEGTLSTSIDYAENANLLDLKDLLSNLNTEISDLAGLYPEITIEDGEGIPYGDGIPNVYEYFGWFYNEKDGFAITTQDGSSVTNYAIITQNGVEILDTRDYTSSLSNLDNFYPSDYIEFPPAGTEIDDVFICTVYLTKYVGDNVNFVHTNYGQEFDYINAQINLTRGLNGGLYNSVVESEWNDSLSPSGTTWNSEYTDSTFGFSDLDTVNTRTFSTFYNALDGYIGGNALQTPLIMKDTVNNKYYTVQITQWTQGRNGQSQGGGFEYTRRLINQVGTATSFQDTLVWK